MASAWVRAVTQQSKGLRWAAIVPNYRHMLQRTLPAGFIGPCLPTKTDKLPSGSQWLHEIKHDGFRIIARKNRAQVRLYSRPGNDLTHRFPLIVETLARLRSRSRIIDGEAVACDDNGGASRYRSVREPMAASKRSPSARHPSCRRHRQFLARASRSYAAGRHYQFA